MGDVRRHLLDEFPLGAQDAFELGPVPARFDREEVFLQLLLLDACLGQQFIRLRLLVCLFLLLPSPLTLRFLLRPLRA